MPFRGSKRRAVRVIVKKGEWKQSYRLYSTIYLKEKQKLLLKCVLDINNPNPESIEYNFM